LELGARSQEPGEKRKKEEGRSQKKCFYKYEMLPTIRREQCLKFLILPYKKPKIKHYDR